MTTEMKQGTGIPQFCIFTFDVYLNKLPFLKKQSPIKPNFYPPKPQRRRILAYLTAQVRGCGLFFGF